MCGIAGVYHFDRWRAVDTATVERMTRVLAHRGPDGHGYYVRNNVGLGHRRLAIIDLDTGAQPMSSRDGSLVLVFNGEIYNYIELREELKSLGHSFETRSDTEVILAAYDEWGLDCQSRFNGMWAFALWDARERLLLLSRDRLGEKPLHFALKDESLFFGSEIKSLLATSIRFDRATDLLHVYLSLGYMPAPYTLYAGISKLMPGQYLVARETGVTQGVYWDLPAITDQDMRRDGEGVFQAFHDYFADSVRVRMRSDVPYGAFLSGGLDSSTVVAAMSQQSARPIQTFTIGFTDAQFDERHLARQTAKHFRATHQEQILEPDTFDESLRLIRHHFDEPFGDASAIPVGLVARLARQQVAMVLTGDGGDEVLSGYTSYLTERMVERYRMVPQVVRRSLAFALGGMLSLTRSSLRYRLNRILRFAALTDVPFDDRFVSKLSLVDRHSIQRLIPSDLQTVPIEEYLSDVFSKCRLTDPFYRLMFFNLKVSLPDDMLAKVDRMTMAHSLEARVPFLDYRLVELTYCAHKDIKLPGRQRKHILRRTYGQDLPPSLLKAPKMPFSVPLREWFKQEQFEGRMAELGRADFGLNNSVIREVIGANTRGMQDCGDFIWRLLVLKHWMQGPSVTQPDTISGRTTRSELVADRV